MKHGKGGGNLGPPPEDRPEFRPSVERCFAEVMRLGKRLLPLFALALDLDERHFDDQTRNPGSTFRLLSYPPQYGDVDLKEIGIGAHQDYELYTILAQDGDVQALQVLNADGEWVMAPPKRGTFVVNIGDQLQRITSESFCTLSLSPQVLTFSFRRWNLQVDRAQGDQPIWSIASIDAVLLWSRLRRSPQDPTELHLGDSTGVVRRGPRGRVRRETSRRDVRARRQRRRCEETSRWVERVVIETFLFHSAQKTCLCGVYSDRESSRRIEKGPPDSRKQIVRGTSEDT